MSSTGAIKLNSFPEPGDRYRLDEVIRVSSFGKTYIAKDTQESDKQVVVKIQEITALNEKYLKDECKLLREFASHANIIDFYEIFYIKNELIIVTEYCEGGPILKIVNDLLEKNRRMKEEHIAHILKEVVKAVSYLHEKHIIHRDLRASNIFLTKGGEVKIGGLGLSITLASTFGRSSSAIGSPDWMAPEVIQAKDGDSLSYDNRSDVWSLGITAIELGDGKTPFKDMHPTRVLFQVVRNPPPTLYRTSNWSENYNDFIAECLVKNPEHRPYMAELMGHPFMEEVPENNYHLSTELTSLVIPSSQKSFTTQEDVHVMNNILWDGQNRNDGPMYVEDLAALDEIDESTILSQIEQRFNDKQYQTYVGEILVTLNPNVEENIYSEEYNLKYMMKSKSENIPHIFAIADSAYQNALHHIMPQKIILSGESGSGKTKNFNNIINHLLFVGNNVNIQMSRIKSAIELIHAFTHASTPYNDFSTRCIMRTDISYGRTGKVSGASFIVNLLEKTRISSTDMNQANFNIFYFLYDGLVSENLAEEYKLNNEREYRYLRVLEEERADRPRVEVNKNISKFKRIKDIMREFEFSTNEKETMFNCMAAILILGEVRFQEAENDSARIVDTDTAKMVGQLLHTDEKKFCWALTNYCLLKNGTVISKKCTCDEARDTRDVLANNIYTRLVDFVVATVNHKLAFGRAIFGEKYLIHVLDYFGFECFKTNELSQMFINIFNEQIQHYYIQRIFKWEMMDITEDKLEFEPIPYYNNQNLLDTLLGRSDGILNIIGQASKLEYNGKYITEYISNIDNGLIASTRDMEFSISHFTGKINYNAKEMPDKNRDFLPPEIVETMRSSRNPLVKLLFTEKLNRTGNLIVEFEEDKPLKTTKYTAAFKQNPNINNFSQSKKLRTLVTVFKAVCLETLTDLSTGSASGGTHFVRCIKTNLKAKPQDFCKELVRQQIRALAIPQTAKIRKHGYAYRIQFAEFLRRYQFLAFDFNETVDMTPDNCRLLLIRLKMEGWIIGEKRVFLKYYNEEYLSRLYESQVKKIIKIQSILRGFLTKCRMKKNSQKPKGNSLQQDDSAVMTEEEAAHVIQKAYRRHNKTDQTVQGSSKMSDKALIFIRPYAIKWKKSSFLHLLFLIRSKRIYDTFNLCMQANFYNQKAYDGLKHTTYNMDLMNIDKNDNMPPWYGKPKPLNMKINYQWNNLPFYNTSNILPDKTALRLLEDHGEPWDKPYKWRNQLSIENKSITTDDIEAKHDSLINLPFTRNPDDQLKKLEEKFPENKKLIPKAMEPLVEEVKLIKNARNEIFYKQQSIPRNENIPLKVNTLKPKSSYISDNTKPANKDFDYIKAPVLNKAKGPDPIAELKSMGRRDSMSDDSPPFNFQGMLRKTNFKRDSMKTVVNLRRFSLKCQDKEIDKANGNLKNNKTEHISFELGPELHLEGTVYDL